MKKSYSYILLLPCITFCVWYFIVSYFNVFSCDDFWHGTNVHQHGFFNAQSYYWNYWEGSYIHTFLATFPHLFNMEKTPFICTLLSYVILVSAVFYFFRTYFSYSRIKTAIYSLFIITILLTFSYGESEIRYWVCANITYLFGISIILIFISCYHRYDFKFNIRGLVLLLLILLIVGNKISYIYALTLSVLVHDCLFKRLNWNKCGITLLLISCLSLLNILAPGNFERLSLNMNEAYHYSIWEVFGMRILQVGDFLLCLIALVPLCIITRVRFNNNTILICTLAYILLFFGDTLIMYICFHDPGPKRGNIIIEISTIGFLFVILNYIFCKINNKVLCLGIFYLCLIYFEYNEIVPISQIKQSIEYSKASLQRNNLIKISCNSQIIVEPLPDSGLLHSYFCNDEEWLQFVYLPYYNKEIEIHIRDKSRMERKH